MELLGLVLIWPFLILIIGLVFISGVNVAGAALSVPIAIALIIFVFGLNGQLGGNSDVKNQQQDLDRGRRGMITFSIALLLPIFVKYLLAASQNSLPVMVIGLMIGFGALVWGMFIKDNKVLSYANVVGGGISIIYLYFQLWTLGQLAQIVAAAFGLVVAIIVSVVKFRDKLS